MAVTDDRNTSKRFSNTPRKTRVVVHTGSTVYFGTMLNYDTATGYVVNGTDAASRRFAGVYLGATFTATADTAVETYLDGEFLLAATSITALMHGAAMYMRDNETFDDTSTNSICVGSLRQWVSNTSGWLDISTAAAMSLDSLNCTFADGGAYTHETALASLNVDAAITELHGDLESHIMSDGAGATQDPGTNAEHCARAVVGWGTGIAYQIIDSGAGLAAESIACPNGFTTPKPDMIQSVGTTGAPPGTMYIPTAILAGAQGLGFKWYVDEASTLDTSLSAAQAPIYRSATGTLTLTRPTGANQVQVVGRVLTAAVTGDICIDFDDWQYEEHSHTDESEGGEIGFSVSMSSCLAWTKNGTDQVVRTPAIEFPYAVLVKRCYACVGTAPDGVGGMALKLNTTACCTIAQAAVTGENEALAIAIGANTDWALTCNEAGAGAGADLRIMFYGTKTAI